MRLRHTVIVQCLGVLLIEVHDQRILLVRIEIRRFVDHALHFAAIQRDERDQLRGAPGVLALLGDAIGQLHGLLESGRGVVQVGILRVVLDRIDHVVRVFRLLDRAQHIIATNQFLRRGFAIETGLIVGVALRHLVESHEQLRLAEVDRACLFVQSHLMIRTFRRTAIFGQVHRSLRALRIELPQIILVIEQQCLIVGSPTGRAVGTGIIGHIVQHIPSRECLRRGQPIERAVRHRAGVPATVCLSIPIGIFASRREAITPVIGSG